MKVGLRFSDNARRRLKALATLNRARLGPYRLLIRVRTLRLKPGRLFSGTVFLTVVLKDRLGRRSDPAVLEQVVYSMGGKGVLPWMEIGPYHPRVKFGEGAKTEQLELGEERDLEHRLFRYLGDLIPAGGHIMFPYDLDEGPLSLTTFSGLHKGVPMVATPIGALLFRIGFTVPLRDWYIAEGGFEGPRKLQFERPLTTERSEEVQRAVWNELDDFLEKTAGSPDPVILECRENAADICRGIQERISGMPLPGPAETLAGRIPE